MTVPNMRETESTGIKKHACLPLTFSIIMIHTLDTKGGDKSNTCIMECVALARCFSTLRRPPPSQRCTLARVISCPVELALRARYTCVQLSQAGAARHCAGVTYGIPTSPRIRCAFSRACCSVESGARRSPDSSQSWRNRRTRILPRFLRRVNRSAGGARRADEG